MKKALLNSLEAAVRELDADPSQYLGPGLSEQDVRHLCTALPFALPLILEDWWQWHNGGWAELKLGFRALSLEAAIATYQERLVMGSEFVASKDTPPEMRDRDIWWHTSWLPVFSTGGPSVIALDTRNGAIRQIDWGWLPSPEYAGIVAPSFEAWIEELVKELRSGRYRIDATHGLVPADLA